MSRKRHCSNDLDSDPNFEPGMQLSDSLTWGNKRKKNKRKKTCTKSSHSQSQSEHQQSQERNSSSSRQKRLKTSNREAVVIANTSNSYSAARKTRSRKRFPALTLLPAEMWLKIFQLCVSTVGPLPFLLRAGGVCRTWRNLAMDPVLWKRINLSFGPIKKNVEFLECLAPNWLSGCRNVILGCWSRSADAAVKLIAKHCPQLQTIDLSRNRWLPLNCVTELFENCQKLKDVDLSDTSRPVMSSIGSHLDVARIHGSSLERLCLTANKMDDLNMNFEKIVRNCPQLKKLNFRGATSPSQVLGIDLNLLETSCPLLRVLDLYNIPLCIKQSSQDTQVLRCGQDPSGSHEHGVLDSLIPRLLHNSTQLTFLDLHGYPEFDASLLLSLPTQVLEALNLSRTGVTGRVLQEIFRKWRHSLKYLDLNFLSLDPSELEAAFEILTDLPTCPLRELSLVHCNAPLSCVRMLTGKLKHLKDLQLENSELPREVLGRFRGLHTLKRLHDCVCKVGNSKSDSD